MYEQEERQLEAYRRKVEELPISTDKLDEAIQNGIAIGEAEMRAARRKRNRTVWSFATVAILVLAFVTTIRISPAFANAVSSIPGMAKIVERIQYDKGLQGIVDHDYYQTVHASEMQDNLTLSLGGVILDETGMIISYSLEAPYSISDLSYKEVRLLHNEVEIPLAMSSYNDPFQKHENRKEDLIQFLFDGKQNFATQDFVLEIELDNKQHTVFSLPFHVPEIVKKGTIYTLNQEVEVENQKMTIQTVTVHPLRVEVKIALDESNSMQVLNFEDMRIENEKGEVWSKIQDGFSGLGAGKTEQTLYLQSNYFEQPEQLYFKFNKIQALPKDESYLLIDTGKRKVLKQPTMGNFEVTKMTDHEIEGRMPVGEEEFTYFYFSTIENANGEDVESDSQSRWRLDGYEHFGIQFNDDLIVNPLKIHFFAYPNYINGDIQIELTE